MLAIGADGHVVLASATAALVGLSPPYPNTPHLREARTADKRGGRRRLREVRACVLVSVSGKYLGCHVTSNIIDG